jgi:long-chain acyl-CoA synthetase
MHIADSLDRWAREKPSAAAIVDRTRVIDFRGLDGAAWRTATLLAADGLRPGDRVGISLPDNSVFSLILAYALARLGAAWMLMPTTDPPAFRLALAQRFGLAAVIGEDTARLDGVRSIPPRADWLVPGEPGSCAAGGDAPFRIGLSSGTTGRPKAVVRTHRDQIRQWQAGRRRITGPAGRFLTLTSLQLNFGLGYALQALDGGGSVHLVPLPIRFAEVCAAIDREDITHLAVTPTLARDMLSQLDGDKPRFPGLRNLVLSTMAAPEALRREIRRRITPNLVICYATNESGYVTSADAATQIAFPETVGRPVDDVEVAIVNEHGRPLPPGQVGLVRVRGPALPAGYIDDPAATAAAFRDGWYHPGDLGFLSADGALFLASRADDVINYDGTKIYPAEIEAALLAHGAVAEAAAFPLAVDGYRQLPAAAVILRAPATAAALLAFCRETLGPHAPRIIHAFPDLPRTATGKVLKRELAQRLAELLAASGRTL